MEFVERNVAETVVYAMGYARVVALLGPRQAGKSTLVRKLAEERLSADYLSLDDEPVRSLAAGDPAGFIAARGRRVRGRAVRDIRSDGARAPGVVV